MRLERILFQDVFLFGSDLRGGQNPRYALIHVNRPVETDRPRFYYYDQYKHVPKYVKCIYNLDREKSLLFIPLCMTRNH
jgi:hypothetical protein